MTRLLTLFLVCLLAGVGGYLLAVRPTSDAALVEYLPEDTLALIEWDNIARSWEAWQRSPAGEKRQQPKWFKMLEQGGVPASLVDDSRQAIAFLEQWARYPSLQTLLGTKAVLALVPDPVTPSSPSPLTGQWMLAVAAGSDFSPQQFQDFLGPVQSQQTTLYQGETVATLVFQGGETLSCWRRGEIVLCARQADLVRRCIDQALQRMVQARSGLQLNAAYQRLKQHCRDRSDLFGYADLERLQRRWPPLRELDAESGGLVPRHLALFHFAEGSENRLGMVALADQEAVAAFTARHRLAAPVTGPAVRSVAAETGFFLWTNWFKPQKLWDLGLQRAHPDVVALMTSVGQQFSEITGKSLDAFFHVFGNGFGVFINEQPVPNQSNRSMGCLIVEVRDRPAVAAMIKQLVAGLQVIAVQSGGMEIFSVMLAGGLLQPAYALLDHHLILADSVDLIEQARQQFRLDPDSGEKERQRGESEAGNLFLFVRTGEMVDRLVPVLTLLAKETGERARVLSAENRLLVRELGLPLLTGLRAMKTSRLRGYAAGDTILLEMDYTLGRQ